MLHVLLVQIIKKMVEKKSPAAGADSPPIAQRKPHQFTMHGFTIKDPYAWLQDPGYPTINDKDILAYLTAENTYFDSHMSEHQDNIDALFNEFKARQQAEDESVPYLENNYFYQWVFAKHAQYRSWQRWKEDGSKQTILDETHLAADCDYFRLGGFDVSPDGQYIAWSADTDGSERFGISVRDLNNNTLLNDKIGATIGCPIWAQDNQTLFYVLVNENWRPYQVMAHVLGQTTEQDRVIYTEQDESFFVGISTTQSEKYLLISSGDHVTSEVHYLPLNQPEAALKLISARRKGHEYNVDHGGRNFYITTNRSEVNFSVVSVDDSDPAEPHWQTIIDGDAQHYIRGLLPLKNHLIVQQRINGLDAIRILARRADGSLSLEENYIQFPEPAYSASLATNTQYNTNIVRISYQSMTTPATVFDYHIDSQKLSVRKVQKIPSGYDESGFSSERLLLEARDGVKIPVSIVYPKDFIQDGSQPLYLYAYGAYGHAVPPGFSTTRLSLLKRGFAFAIAHIRGGDDLGHQWYEDGKLDKRTNTFNDFVDVARELIAKKYTRPGNIAIAGGSAGGELVAAVSNQAPELWGAVVAQVPFVDVLNTMLNKDLPLTPIEWPEWGNPIEDKQAFEHILSYSPYDQLKAMDYPPMLVTAGLNDPRVTYWEPAKYVARLRHLKTDKNLLLLKTNMAAGHGGKSGRFDSLYEVAEEYIFILHALGRSYSPERIL